jgi:hypothetical protein
MRMPSASTATRQPWSSDSAISLASIHSAADDLVLSFTELGGDPARRVFADWLDSTAWLPRLREADTFDALVDGYRD